MKKRLLLSLLLTLFFLTGLMAQCRFVYKGDTLVTGKDCIYVDASAGEDASSHVFSSLPVALRHAEDMQRQHSYSADNPLSIYIAPSVYWINNPDADDVVKPLPGEGIPYGMKLRLHSLRLIGTGASPEHTVIASNKGQTQGAVGNFTMFHITGDDIYTENLTFGNYCNVDLDYPLNPSLSHKRRADAIVQAQLIICNSDRVVARDCRFISRLNLCPFAGAKRALFDNCYFECTDDALCGTGVYLDCRFTLFSSKPFYATSGTGAVFLNCDMRSLTSGKQYLVKVGSQVAMVDCRWESDDKQLQMAWTSAPTDDQRSYQQNVTLNTVPLVLNGTDKPWLTVDMSGKQLLEAYKTQGDVREIYNVYNLLCGNDGWDPLGQRHLLAGKTGLPVQLRLSHRMADIESGVDSLLIMSRQLCFSERADFSKAQQGRGVVRWKVADEDKAYVQLLPAEDNGCVVVGTNTGETTRKVNLLAYTDDGLQSACVLTVKPRQLAPPDFVELPVLRRNGDVLTVDYALQLQGRADESLVSWYRCLADGREIPVSVSRDNVPLKSYNLTAADNGCRIKVVVAPKHIRSNAGEARMAATENVVMTGSKRIETIHTDFLNFPTARQPHIIPGAWTLDCYKPLDTAEFEWTADESKDSWYYGEGVDGAAGCRGLIQAVKGARMMYTPLEGNYGNMALSLLLNPCKSAGQGFGSATGQYMDVCIKFDTKTLTGYALRIIRTTKNDSAVDFQLMRYENGVATQIGEAVTAVCYRAGCRVSVRYEDGFLCATAYNSNGVPESNRKDVSDSVSLRAQVKPNSFGGICIQHTGSVGSSSTLLSEMEAGLSEK